MPITKNCLICKKEFRTYQCKIDVGRGKYCSKECTNLAFKGKHFSKDTEWKKGTMPAQFKGYRFTISRPNGRKYKLIYRPEHPNCTKAGYVREHRLVAEETIGRYLGRDEVAHHVDGDTLNNEPSNIVVMLKQDHDRMNVHLNVHRRWHERR